MCIHQFLFSVIFLHHKAHRKRKVLLSLNKALMASLYVSFLLDEVQLSFIDLTTCCHCSLSPSICYSPHNVSICPLFDSSNED